MDIEVDDYNARYDSPVDKDVIEEIKEGLRNGRRIEYHITVRIKNGKYHCYVGRNRLLAAKEYHPQDPRNIFTVSKFVEESGIPLKRVKILRFLAIDDLPLNAKKGLDEGRINTHTAYELTKFSKDEQLNLYHSFRSFRKISQVARIKALKKYMDNRDQQYIYLDMRGSQLKSFIIVIST